MLENYTYFERDAVGRKNYTSGGKLPTYEILESNARILQLGFKRYSLMEQTRSKSHDVINGKQTRVESSLII